MLTNLETSTEKLLQIVLSGQPELEEKLKLPELRQLRQRIMIRSKTSALGKQQTFDYVTREAADRGGREQVRADLQSKGARSNSYVFVGNSPRH